MRRPVPEVGYRPPYPTVVTEVTDHHRASPTVVMFASGLRRSRSRMVRLDRKSSSAVHAAM
jgi:hypothetical protein